MYIKNKRGQSTVEYVLLVTAVVAVIIAFLSSSNKNGFQSQLNTTLNTATGDMSTISGTLSDSHQAQPASNSSTTPPYSVDVSPSNG